MIIYILIITQGGMSVIEDLIVLISCIQNHLIIRNKTIIAASLTLPWDDINWYVFVSKMALLRLTQVVYYISLIWVKKVYLVY